MRIVVPDLFQTQRFLSDLKILQIGVFGEYLFRHVARNDKDLQVFSIIFQCYIEKVINLFRINGLNAPSKIEKKIHLFDFKNENIKLLDRRTIIWQFDNFPKMIDFFNFVSKSKIFNIFIDMQ